MDKRLANNYMLYTQKNTPHVTLSKTLADQLSSKISLYLLVNKIRWTFFEDGFKKHYSKIMGQRAKHIRLMDFLLILKYLSNLFDENLLDYLLGNLYFQYFHGEQKF